MIGDSTPPDPFEARLRALAPAAPRLDRAAVLAAADLAGPSLKRSPRRSAAGWKLAAAAGWMTAAGLAAAWFTAEPVVRVEERVVVRALPADPPADAEERAVPAVPAPAADDPARLMAWLESPAAGPLTAAGLRTLPPGWPPPPVRRDPCRPPGAGRRPARPADGVGIIPPLAGRRALSGVVVVNPAPSPKSPR